MYGGNILIHINKGKLQPLTSKPYPVMSIFHYIQIFMLNTAPSRLTNTVWKSGPGGPPGPPGWPSWPIPLTQPPKDHQAGVELKETGLTNNLERQNFLQKWQWLLLLERTHVIDMDSWYRNGLIVYTWTHGIDNNNGIDLDSWYIIGSPAWITHLWEGRVLPVCGISDISDIRLFLLIWIDSFSKLCKF